MKALGFGVSINETDGKRHDAVEEILNIEPNIFEGNAADALDINPMISKKVRDRFERKFRDVYLHSEKPAESKTKTELKLYINEKQPFHFAPRKLSYEEKTKLRKILDDLLARKIIRPSSSEYASRTVLVKKKNGGLRLCVDYRSLNKITAKDYYPIPIIKEQINALQGKRYFSLLDLKNDFHYVYMSEESVKYTAFVTPFG